MENNLSEEEIINEELKNNINELIKLLYRGELSQAGKRQLEAHIKNMWVAYEGQTENLHEANALYNKEKYARGYWEQRVNDLEKEKNVIHKDKIKELLKRYEKESFIAKVDLEDLLKE